MTIMGAVEFTIKSKGKTINDAYREAVERCMDEEGDNPYNGTISTTDGFRDVTDKYKASKMPLDKFIDKELESCGKRYCMAVELKEPIPNQLKTKSQVENTTTPGTKKWVLKYVVYYRSDALKEFDTKRDAVQYARHYTVVNKCETRIDIEKMLKEGSPTVARIHYKKSAKECDGEWIFFGMAAC